MQAPIGCDQRRQRLDVRRAQFGVDPPLEELVDHRVGRAELLENGGVGRKPGLRPAALWQVQLEEQDLFQLLGAAEVELVADVGIDALLEPSDLRSELAVEHLQRVEIERDAGRLDPREHRDERQLDLAEETLQPELGQAFLERLADRHRGEGLETGASGRRKVGGRWQDLVEVLRDDIGDGLAAQCGVEDVRGDLRVEVHGQRCPAGIIGEACDEDRLHLVADERRGHAHEQPTQRVGSRGSLGGHGPAVRPYDGKSQWCAAPGPRVVAHQRHADRRLLRQPRLELGDAILAADLDPTRIHDRGCKGGRQVLRRLIDTLLRLGGTLARRRDGVEIEPQLELRAVGTTAGPTGSPAFRATGHPCGRHVPALGDGAQCVGAILGGFAGHRR
jgi:hypothetical protein